MEKFGFAELVIISNALADKMDFMVQNADGTDPQVNLVYSALKDVFKKVNAECSERVKDTGCQDINRS